MVSISVSSSENNNKEKEERLYGVFFTFCRTQRKGVGVNNRTCHPALQVHVIIGGEASKEVNPITNILKT